MLTASLPRLHSPAAGVTMCPMIRLEHLGDSVLSLAVTKLIGSVFPSLRVGPSTVRFTFVIVCARYRPS